jgi:autotransporter-associated beta strand protein
MNLKLSSIPALFCALCASALGQIAFTGTYTPPSTGNTDTTLAYNGTAVSNLTISPLAKVGITSTSSGNNFRGSNWPLDGAPIGSLTGVIDTAKYIEFTLTAATDYAIDLSSISFGVGRSGTGPRQWEWRSSVDGYAAPLNNYTTLNASVTNSSGVLTNPDANSGYTGNVLDLSGLANVTTITFRIYAYNAESANGTGGIQGPLTFAGNVIYTGAAVTGTTWTGTGVASTWQDATTGHFDGTYTNSLTNLVTFGGTGETVTLAGTVQAGDVTISETGFTFGGSALELGKGTILTAADTLTVIDSVITGTAGVKKEGPGQLTLNGVNTFTGGLFVNGGILAISADNELGGAANTITLNGGTLALGGTFSLGSGRTLAGTSGNITLPTVNDTLTINGPVNAGALTFTNGDLIELANASNALTGLTLNDVARLSVSGGELALSGNLTVNTAGITALNGPINFTGSATRTLSVPTGSVRPTGTFTTGSYLVKTGAGTLNLTGTAAAITGLQVGIAGTTTAGTIIVDDAGDLGVSPNQIRLNYGTLQISQPIVSATGFSCGGRETAEARITGSNLELQGLSAFFTGNGTSGQLRLVVNNTTTLSGTVGATGTGGGSATGLTLGGTGKLIIAGDASSFDQEITLNDTVTLRVANVLGGRILPDLTILGVKVGNGTVLELDGATMAGTLTVDAGGLVRVSGATRINGAVVNNGVIEIDGASTTLTLPNTVTNNVGGSIELLNGATLVADASFTNEGVLDLSGAATTQTTPVGITGGGTVIPVGGTIVIPSTTLALSGGQATVTFASQSGRTYQLQVTTDLGTTPIVWTNVGTAVTGTGSTLVLTDAAPPASAKVFYRVMIN